MKRAVYYYPFGYCYPVGSGADRVACNHLDYLLTRGWAVDCVFGDIPKPEAAAAFRTAYPGVRSVTTLPAPWTGAKHFRDQVLLYERAASSSVIRNLFAEPCDLFLTNYVFTAPLAWAARTARLRVLEAVDLMSDSFTAEEQTAGGPDAVWAARRRFLFRVEMDLYRTFDRVLLLSSEEYDRVRPYHPGRAVLVRHPVPAPEEPTAAAGEKTYDLLFVGSSHRPNLRGLDWFYRRVYLPHLRPAGATMAVVGSVCDGWRAGADTRVAVLGRVAGDLDAVYRQAKVVVVPLFEGTGMSVKTIESLRMGAVTVATPVGVRGMPADAGDAVVRCDMRRDPAGAAATIRALLADPGRRSEVSAAARRCYHRHFGLDRYRQTMDDVLGAARPAAMPA